MNTNEIKSMLERYNSNCAIVKNNEVEIQSLQKKLEYAGQTYTESVYDAYSGEVLKAKTISDMPGNCNNQFRSSTETVALSQNCTYNNQFDIESIKSRLNKLMSYIEPYSVEINTVESLLCCLGEKEKFVIENLYKNKLNFSDIAKRFSTIYNFVSIRSMERIRDTALERMERISIRVV